MKGKVSMTFWNENHLTGRWYTKKHSNVSIKATVRSVMTWCCTMSHNYQ
jgi:hypothetical protein